MFADPTGLETLFEWLTGLDDSYRVDALNAVAGFQDSFTFGLAYYVREMVGYNKGVNRCSTLYAVGTWSALILGGGRLLYAGLSKGVSFIPVISGYTASKARNVLKMFFRLFLKRNYRRYSYEEMLTKYGSDAGVKAAAGRTSMYWNKWGAAAFASYIVNDSQCECQ